VVKLVFCGGFLHKMAIFSAYWLENSISMGIFTLAGRFNRGYGMKGVSRC
jgi:hypothetical protein